MSKYKEEIDKMQWSYSRLTSFEHCKYEFYLKYIINDDDEYLAEGNFYAEVGTFVHEILAMIFNGELKIEDAAQYYIDNFDDNVFYKIRQSTADKIFETCASYLADVDFTWLNDYEIIGVEKEVNFSKNGYKFIGFIDLLLRDKNDGKLVIMDNKSSEYPFKKDGGIKAKVKDNFESYKHQMYLYGLAVYEEYGEYPKELVWNHFKDGGKLAKIPFKLEGGLYPAIGWMFDTIEQIENEEDFEASQDYFYCHNLCDFRNSCEYKDIGEKL